MYCVHYQSRDSREVVENRVKISDWLMVLIVDEAVLPTYLTVKCNHLSTTHDPAERHNTCSLSKITTKFFIILD